MITRVLLKRAGFNAGPFYMFENLHSKKSLEKFKLFIGFKNRVCCNLCVWTDGIVDDLRVFSVDEITQRTKQMIREFEPQATLDQFERWQNINLTEQQFAEFIGRCRMYLYMPKLNLGTVSA